MIIEYNEDGRITHIISDPVAKEVREFYLANGAIEALRGVGMKTHYVADGAVIERSECAVDIAVEGRTIRLSKVPRGSVIKVEIEGRAIATTDKTIELDEPGPVSIIVTPPWPMMEVRHDLEIE